MPPSLIIPVLDIIGGVVVRGVAGRREEYRPIRSRWCASPDPVAIAVALQRAFEGNQIYVADLDGIRFGEPQWKLIEHLAQQNLTLTVDAGSNEPKSVERLLRAGASRIVVGLETLDRLETAGELLQTYGTEVIVFSLDLKQGEPMGKAGQGRSAEDIAACLFASGLTRMILLDLSAVGMGTGIPTLPLCRRLKRLFPQAILWTGGGVRNLGDVQLAGEAGVQGVMVASALHDGRIYPTEIL